MQDDPRYEDVVSEVKAFLEERLAFAVAAGHSPRSASGSTRASASARRSSTTSSCCGGWTRSWPLGRPVLVGVSRKRFIGALTGRAEPDRVAGGRRGQRAGLRARRPHVPRARRGRRRRDALAVAAATVGDAVTDLGPRSDDSMESWEGREARGSGGRLLRFLRDGRDLRPVAVHPPRRHRGRAADRPAPGLRHHLRRRGLRRDGHRPPRGHDRLRGCLPGRRAGRDRALLPHAGAGLHGGRRHARGALRRDPASWCAPPSRSRRSRCRSRRSR